MHPVLVTLQAVLGTLALAIAVHVLIQGSSNLDAALVVANISTGCAKYYVLAADTLRLHGPVSITELMWLHDLPKNSILWHL